MNAAHTPGPWHVQAKAGRHYIQAANFTQVACMVRQAESAEMANNADLLAAAPDLLAALRGVCGLLEVYPRMSNDPNGRLLLDAHGIARAAIAKATEVQS